MECNFCKRYWTFSGLIVVDDGVLNRHSYTLSQWLFTSQPALFGLIEGYANPTGIILIFLLTVMTICSMPFVRRGGRFEVVYTVFFSIFIIIVLHTFHNLMHHHLFWYIIEVIIIYHYSVSLLSSELLHCTWGKRTGEVGSLSQI